MDFNDFLLIFGLELFLALAVLSECSLLSSRLLFFLKNPNRFLMTSIVRRITSLLMKCWNTKTIFYSAADGGWCGAACWSQSLEAAEAASQRDKTRGRFGPLPSALVQPIEMEVGSYFHIMGKKALSKLLYKTFIN